MVDSTLESDHGSAASSATSGGASSPTDAAAVPRPPAGEAAATSGPKAPGAAHAGGATGGILVVQRDVASRYAVDVEAVGSGGFATVYLGSDRKCSHRRVAIKKLVCEEADASREAYKHEFRIMQALDHPHICKLFEVFQEGTGCSLVMEYCEGGELYYRIVESPKQSLPESMTADVARQVASALCYAHGRGIAHRDLKPENVCFISRDPADHRIRLIDWGMSANFRERPMKTMVGSVSYQAPEVASARGWQEYGHACDLWSLGVLVYVMLSGRPPFYGSQQERLRAMMQRGNHFMEGLPRKVSSDARAFLLSLLRSDPRLRLSIEEALAHPFLQKSKVHSGKKCEEAQLLSNFLSYGTRLHHQPLRIAEAARQLKHRALDAIGDLFCRLDSKGDGFLDVQELEAAYDSPADRARVVEVLDNLDSEGNRKIGYAEFCAACLSADVCEQVEVVWSAINTGMEANSSGQVQVTAYGVDFEGTCKLKGLMKG